MINFIKGAVAIVLVPIGAIIILTVIFLTEGDDEEFY
jgi:hypothetical protein